MLYHLLYPWVHELTALNLFRYITFRTFGALLTALFISFLWGKPFIQWLKSRQKQGQPIRLDGPPSHLLTKKGTPTMGGGLILISLIVSTLTWGKLTNSFIWIILFITVSFGALGAIDDYLKLTKISPKGLSGKLKLLGQVLFSLVTVIMIHKHFPNTLETHVALPFFKDTLLNLGWFFIPFSMIVIIGSSNAVNLTDGLDGLAIGPVMMVSCCFLIISYVAGHTVFAHYLHIPLIPGAGELSVFCGALIGASLGFLWFNAPPAQVFMGDTGSLALGGALGCVSVMTKHEFVLFIAGGLFVLETLSVILQVGYFKWTKKRLFLMAPIHHHFEKKGWAEQTIVIRFWIISMVLTLIGLATLKLR